MAALDTTLERALDAVRAHRAALDGRDEHPSARERAACDASIDGLRALLAARGRKV